MESRRKQGKRKNTGANGRPRKELQSALEYSEAIIATIREPLVVLDASFRIISANESFYKTFLVKPEENEGKLIYDIGNKQWDIPKLRELLEEILPKNTSFNDYVVDHDFPQLGRRIMLLNARRLHDGGQKIQKILLAIEDITERKRIEYEMTSSGFRYRRLFETAQDGILILDAETGQITDVNPFLIEMLGYQKDEFLGKKLWEISPFKDTEAGKTAFSELLTKGYIRYSDLPLETKDGRSIAVEFVSNVYQVNGQEVIQCNVRNITDRKQAEEALKSALKESQMRSREISALLDAARAVLAYREFKEVARVIFDSCKKLIGATGGYVALLNKEGTANEVLFLEAGGRPCDVDPTLPMPVRGLRGKAYQNGIAVYDNEFAKSEWALFLPHGHVDLDNVLFAPLILQGKPIGLIGLANKEGGFTEHDAGIASAFTNLVAVALQNSMTLDSLQIERDKLTSILDTMEDGVYIIARNGDIEYANPALKRELGPIEGRKCYSYLHDREEVCPWCNNEEVFAGKIKRWEIYLPKTNKTYDLTDTPLKNHDGIISKLEIFHDITERKKSEQMKDEFIGLVSHELKTPITIIMGSINTALSEGISREEAKELLEDAASSTGDLANIIDNLLELSRAQANRLTIRKEPVSIAPIVSNVVDRLKSRSRIHHLVVDIPEGLPEVTADSVRVERIINNLIENAIKYSPHGGNVTIFAQQKDSFVIVGIKDQGIGISKKDQAKLFQPFERLDTISGIAGTGLGLTVCRRLVEAHGGSIWVESEPDQGATFFFTLPLIEKPAL